MSSIDFTLVLYYSIILYGKLKNYSLPAYRGIVVYNICLNGISDSVSNQDTKISVLNVERQKINCAKEFNF